MLLSIFIVISCNEYNKEYVQAMEEINNLVSDAQKNEYLFNLWHEDQHYRGGEEGKIISKYGDKSKEHKAFLKEWKSADNIIFKKLKLYLEVHDYPKNKSAYHELALNAFPIIIGHNHNYKAQKKFFLFYIKPIKEDIAHWVILFG